VRIKNVLGVVHSQKVGRKGQGERESYQGRGEPLCRTKRRVQMAKKKERRGA